MAYRYFVRTAKDGWIEIDGFRYMQMSIMLQECPACLEGVKLAKVPMPGVPEEFAALVLAASLDPRSCEDE